jgi:hypothetical protein
VLVVAGKKEGGENHRKKELSLILQGKRNSTDGREREGRRGWSRVEPTVASGEVAAVALAGGDTGEGLRRRPEVGWHVGESSRS